MFHSRNIPQVMGKRENLFQFLACTANKVQQLNSFSRLPIGVSIHQSKEIIASSCFKNIYIYIYTSYFHARRTDSVLFMVENVAGTYCHLYIFCLLCG